MANQTVGNYWLRAIPGPCVPNNNDGLGDQNAIISYAGADTSKVPTTTAAPNDEDCLDEPASKAIPFVAKNVDATKFNATSLPISSPFEVTTNTEGQVFRWSIGNTTCRIPGFRK